jgi:hypothetical protein
MPEKKYKLSELKELASFTGFSPVTYRGKRNIERLDWDTTIADWTEEIDKACKYDIDSWEYGGEKTGFQCQHDQINTTVPEYCQLKKCTKKEMRKVQWEREKLANNPIQDEPDEEYFQKKLAESEENFPKDTNLETVKPNDFNTINQARNSIQNFEPIQLVNRLSDEKFNKILFKINITNKGKSQMTRKQFDTILKKYKENPVFQKARAIVNNTNNVTVLFEIGSVTEIFTSTSKLESFIKKFTPKTRKK